jgi:copper chaperone CopZ
MKNIFLAIALFSCLSVSAQVSKVTLQASGLTCSMCSNSINKALKTLPFVDKVVANIKTSSFDISFKPGNAINFDDLKRKVEGAGFSVSKMTAAINFNSQAIKNDGQLAVNGLNLHFLNIKNQTLNGLETVTLIDKGFLPGKEYKKNEGYTKMDCYKTGVAGACCTSMGLAAGTRIYHVTI